MRIGLIEGAYNNTIPCPNDDRVRQRFKECKNWLKIMVECDNNRTGISGKLIMKFSGAVSAIIDNID
jgi:hypothetical protein